MAAPTASSISPTNTRPDYISKIYNSINDVTGTLLSSNLDTYFTSSGMSIDTHGILIDIKPYLEFGSNYNSNPSIQVKNFKQNFYALVSPNPNSNAVYPGYNGLNGGKVAAVKVIIDEMRIMAREGGDNTVASILSLTNRPKPNDNIVTNFNKFILRATIALMKSANDNTNINIRNEIEKNIESIKTTAISNPTSTVTYRDNNTISLNTILTTNQATAASIGFITERVNLFKLYNNLVNLANIPGQNGTYYAKRMAQGTNYVIQYYFYSMLLYTLWEGNRSDINSAYGGLAADTTVPTTLKEDCWLVLSRIANLEALLEEDKIKVESSETVSNNVDQLRPDINKVETAKTQFVSNQRVFDVILSKNESNKQYLHNTRWKMLAWAIGLIMYVMVFVLLFNKDIPNVSLENKAMGIIIVNGLIAIFIIVREIIIAFNQNIS